LNSALGTTVVMVTHERPLAERYANRLIFLGDGKMLNDGEPVAASAANLAGGVQ
jgi:ABC-type cobalamin/Fe3+-siderophores transport system ATPase subunit